jgi:hypothetical protein
MRLQLIVIIRAAGVVIKDFHKAFLDFIAAHDGISS